MVVEISLTKKCYGITEGRTEGWTEGRMEPRTDVNQYTPHFFKADDNSISVLAITLTDTAPFLMLYHPSHSPTSHTHTPALTIRRKS